MDKNVDIQAPERGRGHCAEKVGNPCSKLKGSFKLSVDSGRPFTIFSASVINVLNPFAATSGYTRFERSFLIMRHAGIVPTIKKSFFFGGGGWGGVTR